MNNIEKDQSTKNIQRRVIGNQINLFTAVSINTVAPMHNKISSKRPTSNFNARYTPAMRIKSGSKISVMASSKDMAAHQKIHIMNDDSVNFNANTFNSQEFMT